ncbi:hypothetical protein T10_11435 [Trichinella papuae]|uniref:Uncharacterized protein n=1 Tax=Trichinella papuae TaxID=268474 RepID=A0A0V1M4D3_9BILA|nr:hypothetical protein T10_7616 [Trichinella papuae]KRZ67574.1 hypothetical protein T10_11435 [Trichinella papuae]
MYSNQKIFTFRYEIDMQIRIKKERTWTMENKNNCDKIAYFNAMLPRTMNNLNCHCLTRKGTD